MSISTPGELNTFLRNFAGPTSDRRSTQVTVRSFAGQKVPFYINEFWTAGQRQASSIHEISYRACFKPQLPGFFIDLLTKQGDVVYDPFSGRGTTVIEAGLRGRRIVANDANPLSRIMTEPRFNPPSLSAVKDRLETIPQDGEPADLDLSMFFNAYTEREIVTLKEYLLNRKEQVKEDAVDRWIAMVATNRLTGHSAGFFSVYTLPPNQAVSQGSQKRINERRNQVPEYRNTHQIIIRKTKSLLRKLTGSQIRNLNRAGRSACFLTCDARNTPEIPAGSVRLTVTSPPFLDTVQYQDDNWLRCWFNGLDTEQIGTSITVVRTVNEWVSVMRGVFLELFRMTAPGGWVAFEVGEIRKGTVQLEDHVIPEGIGAGFTCKAVMINTQRFTKTSHIWGVDNMECGTNTNRIVIFHKKA